MPYTPATKDGAKKMAAQDEIFLTCSLCSALTLDGTLTANRQNEVSAEQSEQVKKISSWAAIFFAPSFVAGVYGMNFDHMPELHWTLGYPMSLALMVATAAIMYGIFKKKGWL